MKFTFSNHEDKEVGSVTINSREVTFSKFDNEFNFSFDGLKSGNAVNDEYNYQNDFENELYTLNIHYFENRNLCDENEYIRFLVLSKTNDFKRALIIDRLSYTLHDEPNPHGDSNDVPISMMFEYLFFNINSALGR